MTQVKIRQGRRDSQVWDWPGQVVGVRVKVAAQPRQQQRIRSRDGKALHVHNITYARLALPSRGDNGTVKWLLLTST